MVLWKYNKIIKNVVIVDSLEVNKRPPKNRGFFIDNINLISYIIQKTIMNTIKWNLDRNGFTLTYTDGSKEFFTNKPVSTTYVKINDDIFWLIKK